MRINYSSEDNNKKVLMCRIRDIAPKIAAGLLSLSIIMGSGITEVRALARGDENYTRGVEEVGEKRGLAREGEVYIVGADGKAYAIKTEIHPAEEVGEKKDWSKEDEVYTIGADGKRYRVKTEIRPADIEIGEKKDWSKENEIYTVGTDGKRYAIKTEIRLAEEVGEKKEWTKQDDIYTIGLDGKPYVIKTEIRPAEEIEIGEKIEYANQGEVGEKVQTADEHTEFRNTAPWQGIEGSEQNKIYNYGYNFYKTGMAEYVDNIKEWNDEKKHYFNQGIKAAIENGEEMLEGIEAPKYDPELDYGKLSTPELLKYAKEVYNYGLKFAQTGVIDGMSTTAIDVLVSRGLNELCGLNIIQGAVNHWKALGNEPHKPVQGNTLSSTQEEKAQWRESGRLYYTTGQFPKGIDWDMEKCIYFNQGIHEAIENGEEIAKTGIKVDRSKPVEEMTNEELLAVLASEGWFELGKTASQTGTRPDGLLMANGSVTDKMFSQYNIDLSSSEVYKAGYINAELNMDNVETEGISRSR